MKFRLSDTKHYTTGIKLLLGYIFIIIIFSVYQAQQVIKTNRWITNSQEVILYSKKILVLALDYESGFRGYILTGQKAFLVPLEKSQKIIYNEIAGLKTLTGNNRAQQIRKDSLVFNVASRLTFSNRAITAYELNGANAAITMVETGQGKLYTDRIRLLADKIQDTENVLLVQHKDANEKAVRNLQLVLWLMTAGIFLLFAGFIRKTKADNVEKEKAATALKKLNDELEQRVKERTEELDKKEKLFRALVENNEGIISLIDEKLNVLFRSASTAFITGRLFEENEKVAVMEYLHPDEKARVKELIAEAVANPGKTIPVSIRLKHKKGHYIWLEGVVKNMLHDPAIGGIITNLRDISERKKAEEEIIKLATIVQRSPEFIGITALDARAIYLNDGGKEMVELDREIIDASLFDFFTPEDLLFFKTQVIPAIEKNGKWTGEIHLRNFRTGQRIPVLMDIFNIVNPTTQRPTAFATVAVNITERKKAEIKIKTAIERYDILAQATSDTIWDWDILNNTMLYNEGITKMFGYQASEVENVVDWWNEKLYPDDFKKVTELLEDVFDNGLQKFQLTYRFRCADGSYKYIFDRAFVIFNEAGNPSRMIGAMQDITSQVEEEMRTSKAIINTQEQERQYIGAELHDNVNQILASSLLVLGMVKNEQMDTESALEFIDTCKGYITDAIEELRKLSHELAPASFDESSLKSAFEKLLQSFNVNNGFNIKLNFDELCNAVNGDIQINLYRIMQEQIKNIVKYADAGEIEIAVTRSGAAVNMRIADNGKGFDPKTAKNGIGLNNIKKRAESFSGKFSLNSAPGKGCEIIVEIPLGV